MPLYGDPDELDRLAGRLRRKADEVRQHGADHVRRGNDARWVSASAAAYRGKIARDRAHSDNAASELERAAALLEAHAQEVRETIELIARIEEEVSGWFTRQAHALADTVENLVGSAGGAVRRAVQEPPWSSWPIGPAKLPSPGDVKWLEVGKFMQGKGVL